MEPLNLPPWQDVEAQNAAEAEGRATVRKIGRILAVALLAVTVGCYSECAAKSGTGPTPIPGVSPTPSPSPLPSPSASATPDPCAFKAVRVSFAGGSSAQLPTIPLGGEPVRIDATPINDSGPIPDGCNFARTVTWAVLTPTTCQIIGAGFNPFLRGVRVGVCTLTATVERVVSDPFSVEVR